MSADNPFVAVIVISTGKARYEIDPILLGYLLDDIDHVTDRQLRWVMKGKDPIIRKNLHRAQRGTM